MVDKHLRIQADITNVLELFVTVDKHLKFSRAIQAIAGGKIKKSIN